MVMSTNTRIGILSTIVFVIGCFTFAYTFVALSSPAQEPVPIRMVYRFLSPAINLPLRPFENGHVYLIFLAVLNGLTYVLAFNVMRWTWQKVRSDRMTAGAPHKP